MGKSKRNDGRGGRGPGDAASRHRGLKRRPERTGPLAAFDPDNFLTEDQASEALGIPVPDLMALGRMWERNRRASGDLNLSSSPATGLRRVLISPRRYRFHRFDLREYFLNSERVSQGLSPISWRADLVDPEGADEGNPT